MSMKDNKYYKEFKEIFVNMSNDQLEDALKREVGNPGWVSTRAIYLTALREEYEKRGLDYSALWLKLSVKKPKEKVSHDGLKPAK